MIAKQQTFTTVFDKYLAYSEVACQFYQLDEEDKKIVKPYIDYLKLQWQEELQAVLLNFRRLSNTIITRLH